MSLIYDLAIIGGGPAGVAAGVYASRKRLKTVFVARDWGGQSIVSPEIQNWIGTVKVSGLDLADMLKNHLKAYAGDMVEIKEGEVVEEISNDQSMINGDARQNSTFTIRTNAGKYQTKTILVTTGSHRRKLEVPGADRFEHNGVTYCASCDGPLFSGLDVAVIGGGNAGFETAAQLLAYCKSVTLLHRGAEFKADPITVRKVLDHPNMKGVLNVEILAVTGETGVTGIDYKIKGSGERLHLPAQGIFVEVGSLPSTEFVGKLVERDQYGQIIVDPRTQRASVEGVWAAGDCTNGLYHQNNIAAGDAVKALEDIYIYLHAK